jgi:hypothetical protein
MISDRHISGRWCESSPELPCQTFYDSSVRLTRATATRVLDFVISSTVLDTMADIKVADRESCFPPSQLCKSNSTFALGTKVVDNVVARCLLRQLSLSQKENCGSFSLDRDQEHLLA